MEAVVEQPALTDYEIEPHRRAGGKPMPSKNHGKIQARISQQLLNKYEERFDVISELSLQAPNLPSVPDVSIFPVEPSNWLDDEEEVSAIPLTVVEILSPSQTVTELMGNAKSYLATGVASYWLVQPPFRSAVILQPNADELVFHNDTLTDPTNGISIDLKKVFR